MCDELSDEQWGVFIFQTKRRLFMDWIEYGSYRFVLGRRPEQETRPLFKKAVVRGVAQKRIYKIHIQSMNKKFHHGDHVWYWSTKNYQDTATSVKRLHSIAAIEV